MRWTHAVAAAVAATGLAGSVAKATLTVSLVPIPIAPAAAAADPALNSSTVRAFDLRVTQTSERWNVTTMQMALASTGGLSGSFYQSPAPLISHGAHVFQTSFTPNDPQYYDTSFNVTMNNSARTDILGDSDFPAAGSGTTALQSSSALSVAWGDHNGDTNTTATTGGSFSIGRITVKGNTGAFLNGYVAGNVNLNQKQAFANVYIPILGDINGDGVVNQLDLNVVNQNFLSTTAPQADFNDDGVVNQLDLNSVNQNFLNNLAPPPGSALGSVVPEPASISVLGLIMVGAVSRRARRA